MKKIYFSFISLLFAFGLNAQTVVGNASVITPGIEYELTPASTNQKGAYWNNTSINLANNFVVSAELNFGTNSAGVPGDFFSTGADGIAFVLQSIGTTALGTFGEGMGYGGLTNSFAVEMDTWQNLNRNDPAEDHLAFMKNGNVTHGGANDNANRYPLTYDLEDGAWHPITIAWNAGSQTLTVTLDGGTPRSFTGNLSSIIADGGAGTNMVTWGFTAATGSALNQHRIRFAPAPNCLPFTVSASLPALGCGPANTIYLGYGPTSITAVPSTADASTTYTWFKVGTPDMQVGTGATFTPTMAGSYYVVARRGDCTASTMGDPTKAITVIDIRCGKDKQDKVYVCHKQNGTHGNGTIGDNAHSLCIDPSAVPAHLAHGDCLGACPPSDGARGSSDLRSVINDKVASLSVYPNPTTNSIRVNIESDSKSSEVIIRNAQGNIVERKQINGNAARNFDLRKYGTGVFLVQVVNGSEVTTSKVLVKE